MIWFVIYCYLTHQMRYSIGDISLSNQLYSSLHLNRPSGIEDISMFQSDFSRSTMCKEYRRNQVLRVSRKMHVYRHLVRRLSSIQAVTTRHASVLVTTTRRLSSQHRQLQMPNYQHSTQTG